MKLTFPSVVSLDLFYSISSESPGGDNQECLEEVQAIRQAELSLWVSRPRRILSRSKGACECIRTFPVAMTKYRARNERKRLSWLPFEGSVHPGREAWGQGGSLPWHMSTSSSHISGSQETKKRKDDAQLDCSSLPLFTQAGTPSTLKTGTSPLHSLLWKRHTKLYAAFMSWFFLIPIKPTIGIHHPKCWWMSELRVCLSNTWN